MNETFPVRLRRLKGKKRGEPKDTVRTMWTQQRLAIYERGEAEPTAKTICILAEHFEVSTDYLLGRTVENFERA